MNEWKVLGFKNCDRVGDVTLDISGHNYDGCEFSLEFSRRTVAEIEGKTKTHKYELLGALTYKGYEQNIEGIKRGLPKSKLIMTDSGRMIMLIMEGEKRQ